MRFSRRQLLVSTSSLLAGGIAVALSTQDTKAQLDTSIDGLEIPNKTVETETGIKTVKLKVDANYSYATSEAPDRLVLRLEAQTGDKWTQIDAVGAAIDGASHTNTIPLGGSLMVLDGLNTLVPEERGTTNTESIDVRLVLTATHGGKEIGTTKTTQTVELTATKSELGISMQLGGVGEVSVETETPTE